MASRRNRRPRICICDTVAERFCVVFIAGVGGDSTIDAHFSVELQPFAINSLVGFDVELGGNPVTGLESQLIDPQIVRFSFIEPVIGGAGILLGIPPGGGGLVGTSGEVVIDGAYQSVATP